MTNKLRITAFFDGRPGHEKQTAGILAALEAIIALDVTKVELPRPSPQQRVYKTIKLYLPTVAALAPDVDLLIGTGSITHPDILLHKKRSGAKAVTCMLPDRHLRGFFDLCFVPAHDGVAPADNIFTTLGAPNALTDRKQHLHDHGLILIGGIDTSSHHWHEEELIAMTRQIVQRERWRKWTISSSPRTPATTVAMLQAIDIEFANVAFYSFHDTPKGWVEKQYHENCVCWVTADSISMVYEALSAGCQVGLLPLVWKNFRSKFANNEKLLLAKKMVTGFGSWEKHNKMLIPSEEGTLNEAQRCAQHIIEKWWSKN